MADQKEPGGLPALQRRLQRAQAPDEPQRCRRFPPRRQSAGTDGIGQIGNARRVENGVRLEEAIAVSSPGQNTEPPLRAERMPGKVQARQAGPADGNDAVALPNAARELGSSCQRPQDALDHLRTGQQIVRRGLQKELRRKSRRHVHRDGAEKPRPSPPPQRLTDDAGFEHQNFESAARCRPGRGQAGRPRSDDNQALQGRQPFRDIVLQAWTQWATVPPPRITAATLTASAISSGLTPAWVQAEAYESMQ